jgi:periplasmic divalent cation tolerance protein
VIESPVGDSYRVSQLLPLVTPRDNSHVDLPRRGAVDGNQITVRLALPGRRRLRHRFPHQPQRSTVTHIAVSIGVPDESEAADLSRRLVEERIAAGTRTSSGVSHYRWEGEVHERTYWTVTAFTTEDHLDALYDLVDERHADDLPGITYTEIDASHAYLDWIDAGTN